MPKTLKIGTRGSPLALRQTEMVCRALAGLSQSIETEVITIKTSGDWSPADGEAPLNAEEGGKGLFAKEIERALLAGEIDAAVHSMKDMESVLPEGLGIPFMLPREDPRDALLINKNLANNAQKIDDLPKGSKIGTASVRRRALLLSKRPDLEVVPLRGNVQTRIDKLRSGQVDATILACAGLKRLGLEQEIACVLEPENMLPAAGQGAVGIEIRAGDEPVSAIFSQTSHEETVFCVSAERAALQVLDGSCHTPIGAYATLEQGQMHLRAIVAAPDGSESYFEEGRQDAATLEDSVSLGRKIGQALKSRVPDDILKAA